MIRRQLILATGVLVVLTCLSGAFAQGDSVLQRYDLAIENLQVASASVPQDGAQARDELERALNALLTLSRDATSTSLVQAMERTFERTRVAVDNQSKTDIAVQTAVLAGGFSRLVMDSAYLAASNGDLDTARGRLQHLAQRLSFAQGDQAALAAATTAAGLRLAFEAGAAGAISTELTTADGLVATEPDAAYVRLAKAYGESLLVQDSPRVDASLNRNLVGAAQALVANDAAALATAAEAAQASLSSLASAARSGSEGTPASEGPLSSPAPEELPTLAETPSSDTPEAGAAPAATHDEHAATSAAEPQGTAPESAATSAAATDAAVAAATAPGESAAAVDESTLEAAVAARVLALTEEAKQAKLDGLTRELTAAGLPPQFAGATATRLAARGYDALSGVFEQLEAAAGRVVASVGRGDASSARTALADLSASYQQDVAPVIDQIDPSLGQSTTALLTSLKDSQRLTQADAGLLAARTAVIRDAYAGAAPTAADNVEGGVAKFWSGMTRSVVFLILGILAIFPLVLLNMAFGGSNRNWRLVGWALFLLLVPVFYEGVLGLVDLLGSVVDMSWFPDLTRWSMFDSLTGQVGWSFLVLIALILAIVGLRGICVQFGLLGGGKKSSPSKAPAVAAKGNTGHTTIDWDEEF
ncbi:MAG TPA: hypothetical protein VFN07_11005 [Trueperaceae bacterium]|nr:hypothetical protein [Trueperaceae bacterium]